MRVHASANNRQYYILFIDSITTQLHFDYIVKILSLLIVKGRFTRTEIEDADKPVYVMYNCLYLLGLSQSIYKKMLYIILKNYRNRNSLTHYKRF